MSVKGFKFGAGPVQKYDYNELDNKLELDAALETEGKAADAKAIRDVLKADIAPAYSTSATYAVGDYVLYNNALYRCTTAIATAEAWTAAHWTAVNVGGELTHYKQDNKESINRIVTLSSNLVNPEDRTAGYIDINYGTVIESSLYSTSGFMRVDAGQYVRLIDPTAIGDPSNYIVLYDFNKTYIGKVLGSSLTGNWMVFTIPSGAAYTRITTHGTSLENTYFGKGNAVVNPVPKYGFVLKQDGTVDYSQITNSPLDSYIKKGTFIPGTNLYDPTSYVGTEYVTSSGDIATLNNTGRSGIVYLPSGDYLLRAWKTVYGPNNAISYRKYINNQYIGTYTGTLLVDSGNNSIFKITLTEDCGIMFNVRYPNKSMVVRGETSSDYPANYLPYTPDQYKIEDGITFNDRMVDVINGIPLNQKFIAADGDSICYGNGYTGGYAKIISETYGMEYQNIAVGGGTITAETYSGTTARHWICRTMQTLSTDADYLLLEGGVNDASLGVTLGAITSGYTATLDDTTFYGAVETIFKTLTTKYVGKKYGFIIPHYMTSGMYGNGNYRKAIYDCAEKWGVPVLDLTKSVPPFNAFRTTTEYDTIRNAYTTSGDGWHPTEECYRKYYVPQIVAWMKTL